VLDLDMEGGSKVEASGLTDRLREALLKSGQFTLVDRSNMDAVLDELALQQTGCTSQECAVQVGRILGVRKIIVGKVTKFSDQLWQVACLILDVESSETLRAESVIHEGGFVPLLRTGIVDLAGKLAGDATTRAPAPPRPAAPPPAPAAGIGRMFVSSNPKGGEILLDGRRTGLKTDTLVEGVPAGRHAVGVINGNQAGSQTVVVNPDELVRVAVKLEVAKVPLFISSEPFNAHVKLDGRSIGNTPVSTQVTAGTHALHLELGGYAPHVQQVDARIGEENRFEIRFAELGVLRLTGLSADHQIQVDGTAVRPDRSGSILLAPGTHVVKASRPRFNPRAAEVALKPGEILTLNVGLVPVTGSLTVIRPPPSSRILLTGPSAESWALPLKQQPVPIGQYHATIRAEGSEVWNGNVTIATEQETLLDVPRVLYERDHGIWQAKIALAVIGALGFAALGNSEAEQVRKFNEKYANPSDLSAKDYIEYDSQKKEAEIHRRNSGLAYAASLGLAVVLVWVGRDEPEPPPENPAATLAPVHDGEPFALAFEWRW
jgi:hypothetical protein